MNQKSVTVCGVSFITLLTTICETGLPTGEMIVKSWNVFVLMVLVILILTNVIQIKYTAAMDAVALKEEEVAGLNAMVASYRSALADLRNVTDKGLDDAPGTEYQD